MKHGGWTKPIHGYLKLNVDALFDLDTLQASIGVVLRDCTTKIIVVANGRVDVYFDTFTVEATTLKYGVNPARTVVCDKIEVNSDNLEVITYDNAGRGFHHQASGVSYLMIVTICLLILLM